MAQLCKLFLLLNVSNYIFAAVFSVGSDTPFPSTFIYSKSRLPSVPLIPEVIEAIKTYPAAVPEWNPYPPSLPQPNLFPIEIVQEVPVATEYNFTVNTPELYKSISPLIFKATSSPAVQESKPYPPPEPIVIVPIIPNYSIITPEAPQPYFPAVKKIRPPLVQTMLELDVESNLNSLTKPTVIVPTITEYNNTYGPPEASKPYPPIEENSRPYPPAEPIVIVPLITEYNYSINNPDASKPYPPIEENLKPSVEESKPYPDSEASKPYPQPEPIVIVPTITEYNYTFAIPEVSQTYPSLEENLKSTAEVSKPYPEAEESKPYPPAEPIVIVPIVTEYNYTFAIPEVSQTYPSFEENLKPSAEVSKPYPEAEKSKPYPPAEPIVIVPIVTEYNFAIPEVSQTYPSFEENLKPSVEESKPYPLLEAKESKPYPPPEPIVIVPIITDYNYSIAPDASKPYPAAIDEIKPQNPIVELSPIVNTLVFTDSKPYQPIEANLKPTTSEVKPYPPPIVDYVNPYTIPIPEPVLVQIESKPYSPALREVLKPIEIVNIPEGSKPYPPPEFQPYPPAPVQIVNVLKPYPAAL